MKIKRQRNRIELQNYDKAETSKENTKRATAKLQ